MIPRKVLFLLPYPLHQAPSQRFRVEAYFNLLKENEITFNTHEFLDKNAWQVLYKGGSILQKVSAVLKGFWKRAIKVFFKSNQYDYIFIHREAAPLGPPFFEWFLAKVLRKKIIYDFDDAIWIPNVTDSNRLAGAVKAFWKVPYITRWSHTVSAGNAYLAKWAWQHNHSVVINPTCVDMQWKFNRVKQHHSNQQLVLGWTGSHSTLKYLDEVYPLLKRLQQEYSFTFLVICNEPPRFSLPQMQFIKWNEESEIEDLLKMDIGIMPLKADAWSEGKCGFKLIQYLSLGIPAVASPVGVNAAIIEEGINGFLCHTDEEWYRALKTLLQNYGLRAEMGKSGRHKMQAQYSVQSNAPLFLSLFSQ